jgi:thioredoxin-related protein
VKSGRSDIKINSPGSLSFQSALDSARRSNKRLLVYFSGHGCHDCRLTEYNILSDSIIRNMLIEDFVFVTYFVDEKSDESGKVLEFQKQTFIKEEQPYFAILNQKGRLTAESGMIRNRELFKQFLNSGLK